MRTAVLVILVAAAASIAVGLILGLRGPRR